MINCIYLMYDGDCYYCSEYDSTYEKTLSNMDYQNCGDCEYRVPEDNEDEDDDFYDDEYDEDEYDEEEDFYEE